MFTLILFILLILNSSSDTPDVVKEYHEVLTKTQELHFINKYQNSNEIDVQAYVISLKMKHAKYKFLPWHKLKEFNTHKKQLENLITKHSKNVHLRYIRLVIQEKSPKILNYNSEIKNDKDFLVKIIEKKDSTDYLDTYIIKNTSL